MEKVGELVVNMRQAPFSKFFYCGFSIAADSKLQTPKRLEIKKDEKLKTLAAIEKPQ